MYRPSYEHQILEEFLEKKIGLIDLQNHFLSFHIHIKLYREKYNISHT